MNNTVFKEPLLYHVNVNKKCKTYINSLFIQKKIYDNAMLELFNIHVKVMNANPNAVLCGRKVDLLAYKNAPNLIETSNRWGDVKISPIPTIHLNNMVIRKVKYEYVLAIEFNEWTNIEEASINDIKKGGMITGMAGTGKSTYANKFKEK